MADGKESIRNYLGYGGTDHRRRKLDESIAWDDETLESTHDYVQWWFPLTEQSAFNSHAPVACPAEFEELRNDERVQVGVQLAMLRMLRFYGLCLDESGVIRKSDEWNQRSLNWVFSHTHNDLRITRMLKSLCLFGHRAHAEALLAVLEEVVTKERHPNAQMPLCFWREALL